MLVMCTPKGWARGRVQVKAANRALRITYRGRGAIPRLLKLAALMALIAAAKLGGDFVQQSLGVGTMPRDGRVLQGVMVASLIAYTLLIAVPFVPGIEIGLALLVLGGAALAVPVFLCTLFGLSLSYAIGRLAPPGCVASLLRNVKFEYTAQRIDDLTRRTTQSGNMTATSLSKWIGLLFLKYRNVALAVALNVPGNAIVGGGGGIALMAGMCRLYSWWTFLLTIAIAISPVPLIVMIFGADLIGR